MLRAQDVSVQFGGVSALRDVSIDVERGSVTGLIGPNGSGKTTLLNTITGYRPPDSGAVSLDDEDITRWSVRRIASRGIGRTYQTPRLFTSLTVRENVEAAVVFRDRQPSFWQGLLRAQPLRDADSRARADALLRAVHLDDVGARPASDLALGQARQVEVARALAAARHFLLLDEPGAGLRQEELDLLGNLLVRLAAERDIGVLIVEHNVPFVREYCERVFVLNYGRLIASGSPEAALADPDVAAAYLGTAV